MRLRSAFRLALASAAASAALMLTSGCGSDVTAPPKAAAPTTQASSVTPKPSANADDVLRDRLDAAITAAGKRKLKYGEGQGNAAWQVIHGVLAYGPDLILDYNGADVPALDHVLSGGTLTGWNLRPGEKGVIALVEQGSKTGQGHKDQWLGYLSACNIAADHPVKVGGKDYKFIDLATQAQWECEEGQEFGWTLSGLLPFVPLDAKWQSKDGQEWTFERMIELEAKADLAGASCGGTHSAIGVANVLNQYLAEGGQLTGGWTAANDRVQFCVQKAKEHQQQDGSFSTGFFNRSATVPEISGVIHANGHTLEFLCWALTDAQLNEPWVGRAVDNLLGQLEVTKDVPVECGALYHAARGLQLYRGRRFGFAQENVAKPAASESVESASAGQSSR
ncbi:MAG: ADP-ribosylation factor-directed GTPase activating protein isoform b [Planctomycetia bacterium]|nr:ADP-ribosylation factor-directed GTPase activating protein isoform b [Planctomycetia bacterium]